MKRKDNKSLNMLNSDEGCIRYLMREMDPAEEVEFEREMLNDENLLIEVETLRRTYQKLGKLPEFQPPTELVDEIRTKAVAQQRAHNHRFRNRVIQLSKAVASVAAALMVVSTAVYFYGGTETQQSTAVPVEQNTIEPWVDRNEVILFVGTSTQSAEPNELDAEVDQSFGKLRLVNSETGFSTPNRRIVLTSTNR